jgi:GxxExxY protein
MRESGQDILKCQDTSRIHPISEELNLVTGKVVDAAYTVHTRLGSGLLENVYEMCLAYELEKRAVHVQRQVVLPVTYDSLTFEEAYRIDLLVEGKIVVELKAVSRPSSVHVAQLLTYMKLGGYRVGLLFCFHSPKLKDGIVRRAL